MHESILMEFQDVLSSLAFKLALHTLLVLINKLNFTNKLKRKIWKTQKVTLKYLESRRLEPPFLSISSEGREIGFYNTRELQGEVSKLGKICSWSETCLELVIS